MSERGYKSIKNDSEESAHELELSKALETAFEEYSDAARLIIKRLDDRRRVNKEFLVEIENFVEYAKDQVENIDIDDGIRLRYLDLVEEEESLRDRIKEDLKRNDKLIESIKKSTDILIYNFK
jgi:topoisomerase IA-like protein